MTARYDRQRKAFRHFSGGTEIEPVTVYRFKGDVLRGQLAYEFTPELPACTHNQKRVRGKRGDLM